MPRPRLGTEQWQAVADSVLPGTTIANTHVVVAGGSHEVLILPGVAVLRVARTSEAQQLMSRRLALLNRLNELAVPFRVPMPLSRAVQVHGLTAAALSWVPGVMRGPGPADARQLRRLLDTLAEIDIEPLAEVLDQAHAYAGREQWLSMLIQEVLPRLPTDVRGEARRRIESVTTLPRVVPGIVHGDLAGANLLWNPDGTLSGVLDWDLTSNSDPAIDAACLAWFGWPVVREITGPDMYLRARTWSSVFGLEQISAAVLDGRSEPRIQALVTRTANSIRTTVAD